MRVGEYLTTHRNNFPGKKPVNRWASSGFHYSLFMLNYFLIMINEKNMLNMLNEKLNVNQEKREAMYFQWLTVREAMDSRTTSATGIARPATRPSAHIKNDTRYKTTWYIINKKHNMINATMISVELNTRTWWLMNIHFLIWKV